MLPLTANVFFQVFRSAVLLQYLSFSKLWCKVWKRGCAFIDFGCLIILRSGVWVSPLMSSSGWVFRCETPCVEFIPINTLVWDPHGRKNKECQNVETGPNRTSIHVTYLRHAWWHSNTSRPLSCLPWMTSAGAQDAHGAWRYWRDNACGMNAKKSTAVSCQCSVQKNYTFWGNWPGAFPHQTRPWIFSGKA